MCNFASAEISTIAVNLVDVTSFECYFSHPERYNGISDYIKQMRNLTLKLGNYASSNGNCSVLWTDVIVTLAAFY